MALFACGISHHTAPLDVREKFAVNSERHRDYLQELTEQTPLDEAVLLSTCNRTELYCHTDKSHDVLAWLCQRHHLDPNENFIYTLHGDDVVRHMMRVAAGLDSMVLGEPQILGQIKSAYRQAIALGTIGTHLHELFRYVFSVSKQVRTHTAIGINPVSMAFAGVSMIQRVFEQLSQAKVLLIGAGETTQLVGCYLQKEHVSDFIIANRRAAKAADLADKFQGRAIAIHDIPKYLSDVDIIVSATASSLPILGKGAIESAFLKRKNRRLVILDLAVPRDVEVEVGSLDNVYLYNVDDLQHVVDQGHKIRQDAAIEAEQIIDRQLIQYRAWQQSLHAVGSIRAFREQANAVAKQEQQRALAQLEKGKKPETVLEEFSHRLLQKVLHTPSVRLRKAGFDNRQELVKLAEYLFQHDEHST